MTANSTSEALPPKRGISSRVNPLFIVRVLQVALWLLVVSGPVAAVLLATQVSALGDRLETVDGQVAVEPSTDTTGAEGFAELFIAAFLGAGEDSPEALAPFLDDASLDGVTDGSWFATRTTTLGAREVGPGYYAVTVSAEVVAAVPASDGEGMWIPVGTRFYTVGVAETETGWAVTGLPTLIAAPARAVPPELLVGRLDGLDGVPGLDEMVPRFLAAFLAGDGELARYTAPSSDIVAVQPPPFVNVEVLKAGFVDTPDGSLQVAVIVGVGATDTAGRVQVLQYALVVEQRDGRWEVSELLLAPPLKP